MYWTLKILLSLILFFVGYYISYRDKNNQKYWKAVSIAIIAYSLEMGLRWNRSYDYAHYYQDLTGVLYQQYDDILYLLWIDFFKMTGFPYWVAFIFYSFILIFAFALILRRYPKAAVWALPLLLFVPSGADNHIRQFFSIAFGLIGYYYLLEKKGIKSILFFLCCITIHFLQIYLVAIILFFHYFSIEKVVKTPYLIMGLFSFLYFFWDPEWLGGLASYLETIDGGDSRAGSYLGNAGYWLSDESDITNKTGASIRDAKFYYVVITFIIKNSIIYYGYKALLANSELRVFYGSTVIILLLGVIGGQMEIFYRFIAPLQCFEALLVGLMWSNIEFKSRNQKYVFVILGLYYYVWLAYFTNIQSFSPVGYAYVWDL